MDAKTVSRAHRSRPRLDPCYDYIIFETTASVHGEDSWASIKAVLENFQGAILEQKVQNDRLAGRSTLVVKLDPQKSEHVQHAMLALKITSDIVVSLYYRPTRSDVLSIPKSRCLQRRRHLRRKKKVRHSLIKPTQPSGGTG